MKEFLKQLVDGRALSTEQAIEAFDLIMSGQASPVQTSAVLALIQVRGPTVDELVGAATVMRRKVTAVDVPDGLTLIDTCGAGGTGSTFFNISTASALVAAAAGHRHGIAVAKHGNRSVTSRSGSSQVLEVLGLKLQVDGSILTRCLAEAGFCFCFAPAHHPAMKHAVPVRQDLGIATIFNLLGPLTNPAGVRRQLMGVPNVKVADLIAETLLRLESNRAMLVHTVLSDGRSLGELTTFGPAQIRELHHGVIKSYTLDPANLDLPVAMVDSVTVEGPQDSARLIRSVLDGQHGSARDITCLNASAALVVADVASDLAEGIEQAAEAIDSGLAQKTLEVVIKITGSDSSPRA